MIEQYCIVDDPLKQSDLNRIDCMLCSDNFLKALGVNARNSPPNIGFPVVTDLAQATELLRPVELYRLPEPWPYQEFYAVIEDEDAKLGCRTGISDDRQYALSQLTSEYSPRLWRDLSERVSLAFETHKVRDYLLSQCRNDDFKNETFSFFVEELIPHNISGFVYHIIKTVYYGGLQSSRINLRVLEAFETGGLPCGWLGPLPEEGGDPVKAVAVLHFGE